MSLNSPHNNFLVESTVYRANQLWKILPSEIKEFFFLKTANVKNQKLDCGRCHCQCISPK